MRKPTSREVLLLGLAALRGLHPAARPRARAVSRRSPRCSPSSDPSSRSTATIPVAYFKTGKPQQGHARSMPLRWNGATWHFASAENLARFRADPDAYLPQYGGYCAWAVSQGYTAKGDPLAWRIVGGKLYLNYDASIQRRWEADIPGHIAKGDQNWPVVLDK